MAQARALLTVVSALTLSLLASCGGSDPIDGLSLPVDEQGPFAVGYREIDVTYTPPSDVTRTLRVAIWYPADPDATAAIAEPELAFYTIVPSSRAVVGAPLADPAYDAGYPVIMHSHGASSFAGNSFLLAEGFATHGFVVVAPTHNGDTLVTASAPVPLANRYERPLDISATLDALAALPASDPFAGRLVTDRVVLTGHSRGSFTVWAALGATFDLDYVRGLCEGGTYDAAGGCPEAQIAEYEESYRDTRIVAAIPMAGSGDRAWFGGAAGMNGVTTPILMMTGSADEVGAGSLFTEVTAPDITWVDIEGGCHQLYGFGGCEGIVDSVGQPLVLAYALAFTRHHLLGDTSPQVTGLLDGTVVLSAELVTLETR